MCIRDRDKEVVEMNNIYATPGSVSDDQCDSGEIGREEDQLFNPEEMILQEDEFKSREEVWESLYGCLLYTSPSPRDRTRSRMPSSA